MWLSVRSIWWFGLNFISGTQASLRVIPDDQGALLWASKEMHSSKKLLDYVGKIEKTKIAVKLQKKKRNESSQSRTNCFTRTKETNDTASLQKTRRTERKFLLIWFKACQYKGYSHSKHIFITTNNHVIDSIQSLIGTIKPLINSLRHTVSESTFVFYSSSV